MHNSSNDVRVFFAVPKIIVEHAFEVRLVAEKLNNATSVALQARDRIEFLRNKYIPSIDIGAPYLVTVPLMFDRPRHEADLW
jgi:hypothetical protein